MSILQFVNLEDEELMRRACRRQQPNNFREALHMKRKQKTGGEQHMLQCFPEPRTDPIKTKMKVFADRILLGVGNLQPSHSSTSLQLWNAPKSHIWSILHVITHALRCNPTCLTFQNLSAAHLTGAELIQPDMIPVDTLSGCAVLIGLRHMSFGLRIISVPSGGKHIMQLSRWWFRNEYLPLRSLFPLCSRR